MTNTVKETETAQEAPKKEPGKKCFRGCLPYVLVVIICVIMYNMGRSTGGGTVNDASEQTGQNASIRSEGTRSEQSEQSGLTMRERFQRIPLEGETPARPSTVQNPPQPIRQATPVQSALTQQRQNAPQPNIQTNPPQLQRGQPIPVNEPSRVGFVTPNIPQQVNQQNRMVAPQVTLQPLAPLAERPAAPALAPMVAPSAPAVQEVPATRRVIPIRFASADDCDC